MTRGDWFQTVTGFSETSYDETRKNLDVESGALRSRVNNRTFRIGELETPTLADLRARAAAAGHAPAGRLRVSVITGDAGALHRDGANAHALFQVASQFNLLEMTGPGITPEMGVARYASDRTQGPACAIAAGAATIYRNYFVPVHGAPGQTHDRQIDCLREVGDALGNDANALWTMRNGYALCSEEGLAIINRKLASLTDAECDSLRGKLRIGLHWDVEVTAVPESRHLVSQAFCSALPVSYTPVPAERWASFATLVLEAAYEATLLAAIENAARGRSNIVHLTLLGGGAFGNRREWILHAIRRALHIARDSALDVRIVSYGGPEGDLLRLVQDFGTRS
jgi:hypothetical protein